MLIHCDFHCHSKYSKDSLASPKRIIETCIKKGIQRIAITDHDTIQGALEAHQLDPSRVIVGEEITTTKGELLAFFVKEKVPSRLTPYQSIAQLHKQEAFISVSHPFDTSRKHWDAQTLRDMAPDIDAIEIFNARCMVRNANQLAFEFAQKYNLLGTVGSDAHMLLEIANAFSTIPQFDDKTSLKNALKEATFHVNSSGLWVHVYSVFAKLLKKSKNP